MQEERNDLLQTSGMQQIKEEMSSNAKSFYIRTHKNQRARQRHNKSFVATSCTTVNPQVIDKQRWKRRRTACYKPRNLKHRGITMKPEYSLKLYSRELSSTIDRYKNGKNAYIYSN
jgi:hypothetical protein